MISGLIWDLNLLMNTCEKPTVKEIENQERLTTVRLTDGTVWGFCVKDGTMFRPQTAVKCPICGAGARFSCGTPGYLSRHERLEVMKAHPFYKQVLMWGRI